MILYDRLDEALQGLPSTAGGVADYLVDRAITGVRDDCTACPLARWLRTELHVPFAFVDVDEVWVTDDQGNRAWTEAPHVVTQFVANFDDYEYADLVDHNGLTDEEAWQVAYDARV